MKWLVDLSTKAGTFILLQKIFLLLSSLFERSLVIKVYAVPDESFGNTICRQLLEMQMMFSVTHPDAQFTHISGGSAKPQCSLFLLQNKAWYKAKVPFR